MTAREDGRLTIALVSEVFWQPDGLGRLAERLDQCVQRGLRSRSYDTGRFSAKRENGVYHFQNLVREFLGE